MWIRNSRVTASVVVGLLAMLGTGFVVAEKESPHSGPAMNYHRVNDQLVTGGHLLDGGSAALKKEGVTLVINLRDDAPSTEEEQFVEQGIDWINIPVEWRDPKKADFDRFSETMRAHQGEHILVQCSANYRASAMTYLYRVLVQDVPEEVAEKDLLAVWDPSEYDTWREYLNDVTKTRQE